MIKVKKEILETKGTCFVCVGKAMNYPDSVMSKIRTKDVINLKRTGWFPRTTSMVFNLKTSRYIP